MNATDTRPASAPAATIEAAREVDIAHGTDEAGTMHAIVQDAYGPPEVLQLRETERPAIGDDDVLIRVRAAGVHIGDWHLMAGLPYLVRLMGYGFRAPKARVRGIDVAGTVEAVGKNVAGFRPGDEVFGTCDGSFAEYARARADTLAPRPMNLTFAQAAAVPTSACTALQALRDVGQVRPGQRVLIIGASGGVGLFAVPLAKAFGAEVTGVCSAAKADLVRAVGADRIIDYRAEDFTRSGQHYDLILDMAGTHPLSRLRRVLTPRGTLVIVGGEGGGPWLGVVARLLRAALFSPFVRQSLRPLMATTKAPELRFLAELIEAGKVTPIIDRTYALGETPDAIHRLTSGRARGKLVIAVRGGE